jgi:branched-chain amino acid transport system substrate-binding protein
MKKIIKIIVGLLLLLVCLTNALQAEQDIKIAAIFAKSGEAAQDNLELYEAVRFAVSEINAGGGLHKRFIKLIEYDNHSTPIQSMLAAKQAVKDGVMAVIGASWSAHSLAMAPYLQKMKVPMISPDSTHPDVTLAGDYIFRACFVDSYQGKVLAEFATNQLHAVSAVIVRNINSNYSIELSNIFKQKFLNQGGSVLSILDYKSGQIDFSNLLSRAKLIGPDVLFIPGHSESGFVVRQAMKMGISAKMLGGDGWPSRQFYANGGQDLIEGYYTAQWHKELDDPRSRDFVSRYTKVYEVSDFTATAYDAAMILFDAIKRASKIDHEAIRNALASTRNYEGVSGDITFKKTGDPIKQVVVMEIFNGRPSILMTIQPD